MSEDTALRFHLCHQIARMRYGDGRLIDRDEAFSAWAPTGDEDRSLEGAFRALALASGGHRPEESLTTIQRIERDIGSDFLVEIEPVSGGIVITRKLSMCPKCRGNGWYEVFEASPEPANVYEMEVMPVTATVSKRLVGCDHEPKD